MNFSHHTVIASLGLALLAVGCADRTASPTQVTSQSPASTSSAPVADQWLGKWNGPEGTFINLAGSNGKYEVTIQNLDGPRTFQGKAVGDRVEFERDGVKETVRATNGTDTGMKWLSEKKNCLTVRASEGFCRD
jgi:hypothetical protein